MSVNRIVVLLTPIFTLAATVGAGWLAKHFPGLPTPTSTDLLAVELIGATAALSAALGWLRGHHILLQQDALVATPTAADEGDAGHA